MSILDRPSRTVYPGGNWGYALGMVLDFILKARQRIRDFFDGKNKVPIMQGIESVGWLLIFGGGGFVVGALALALLNDVESEAVLLIPFGTAGLGLLAYPLGKRTLGFLRTIVVVLALPALAMRGMGVAVQILLGEQGLSSVFFGTAGGILVGLALFVAYDWFSQRIADRERAELVLGLLMLPALVPLALVVGLVGSIASPDPIFGVYLLALFWLLAGPRGG